MDPASLIAALRVATATAGWSRRRFIAGATRRRTAHQAGLDAAMRTLSRLWATRQIGLLDRRPGYRRLLSPPWAATPYLVPVLRDTMLAVEDMTAAYYALLDACS